MKTWVVAFSLMFACIAGRAEAQVKTLEVVTFGGGNNWPVWIATDQGIFAKNNLAVNLTLTPGSVPLMQNLVSGKFDIAVASIDNLVAYMEGQGEAKLPAEPDLIAVFGSQSGTMRLMAHSPIKSFADLKGKSLGHVPGIQWRTISRHMVRSAGLDPDTDVKLVDLAVAMQVPAVVGGTVDATLSLEPVGSIAVASGKAARAMTNPVATVIADPFYSGASLMTVKFLKERPDVARKVVAAIDEATDLVNANFAKYKPILSKYTPIKEDQLEFLAQPYLRGFKDLNETDLKSYQALVDVFVKEGVIAGPMNVKDKLLAKSDLGN